MHVAEMDFEVAPVIRAILTEMIQRSDLGYLGPIPEVAEGFDTFASSRWRWKIDKSKVKLATDVGVAAVEILRLVTKPGDRVLINSPVYSSFRGWISEVGAVIHDVPLTRTGETWRLDLDGIEKAFQEGVKVYLLCSPQNPVGTIHSRDELLRIAELAHKYDALVISDEIHAPLSWKEFTPYLALGKSAEETGVTVTSSSKAWNTAGLKAAFLVYQSEKVAERLKALPDAMHWRSSLLGAFAMAASFSSATAWLDQTNEQIEANYEFLKQELKNSLPKAKLAEMESTYLAWIDLSDYPIDNPATEILRAGRVSLVPGEDHGGGENFKKFVRLNFATSQDRIRESVRRMASVLEG
jgi:cystathionine beta-lyase